MGMYDEIDIDFTVECPHCQAEMIDFQSKDADCQLDHLSWREVDNFYTYCDGCEKIWVEYYYQGDQDKDKSLRTIEDYKREFRPLRW